jgi:hypothetical protein
MKTYGRVDVQIHVIFRLSSGWKWSASRGGRFIPPGTHWIVSWVGLRTGLDEVEWRKILPLTGLELRPLGRPAGIQLLHRLPLHFLCSY